jgi:hypothetical protein
VQADWERSMAIVPITTGITGEGSISIDGTVRAAKATVSALIPVVRRVIITRADSVVSAEHGLHATDWSRFVTVLAVLLAAWDTGTSLVLIAVVAVEAYSVEA